MQPDRRAIERIRRALEGGAEVADSTFDALLPSGLRPASEAEWTPLAACVQAARWLAPSAASRVLDVGSGAGKLCIAGALHTGAEFTGIEHRAEMVSAARALAGALGAATARFLEGDALQLDWSAFTSVYFYNPFVAPFDAPDLPAPTAELLREKLARLRTGSRVVVYHALGCELPGGFRAEGETSILGSPMTLWVRE